MSITKVDLENLLRSLFPLSVVDIGLTQALIPIAKASIFNTALPVAEVDWLTTAITPTSSPSYLRIYVCVAVGGVLRVARTVAAVMVTENLNDGVALVANSAYMFTVEWRTGDSINIRYSGTGANITVLRIDEIGGAE